ncbi:hypothetical protein QL093DRAFT_1095267 [Fusarium oxysporum]|nr:hypothetical protein QL093DRAFT_1095267 [Fusarium oxysporum]
MYHLFVLCRSGPTSFLGQFMLALTMSLSYWAFHEVMVCRPKVDTLCIGLQLYFGRSDPIHLHYLCHDVAVHQSSLPILRRH